MGNNKDVKQLEKLLSFILERRPDEFGLIPDSSGFVKIKDLLIAICEDPQWRYVRRSHIQEVFVASLQRRFDIDNDRIRALEWQDTARPVAAAVPPRLLYHCVRRSAHRAVLENGIGISGGPCVWLAATEQLALRIGKRRDLTPVLLTIHAQKAHAEGLLFSKLGELIYVAETIPVCYLSGPMPSKEKQDAKKPAKQPPVALKPLENEKLPLFGGFALSMDRSDELQRQRLKQKGLRKDIEWKKNARKDRRARNDWESS